MESKNIQNALSPRAMALEGWLLEHCGLKEKAMIPMLGDASFRRYYRIMTQSKTYIAMDAPPPQEHCHQFILLSRHLRKIGVQAPEIIQADVNQGFLLLTDFGDETYLQSLNEQNADELYTRAMNALLKMQADQTVEGLELPLFTEKLMRDEWQWCKDWFFGRLLGLSLSAWEERLDDCFNHIIASITSQPQVFMHRDYHSANLMVLPDDVGVLDFQDAFIGPVTYDAASLLRDCYIDWPDAQVRRWVLQYQEMLQAKHIIRKVDQDLFMRWFDMMGMQRHLKALFTFARKKVRDNQPAYLKHVPRTLNYIQHASQSYPELKVLFDFINIAVKPALEKKRECLCVP